MEIHAPSGVKWGKVTGTASFGHSFVAVDLGRPLDCVRALSQKLKVAEKSRYRQEIERK